MGHELIAEDRLPALLQEHQKVADQALVERARKGDQEAFSGLVRAHRAQAYGWANKITRDSHLAEDIVQDALIRAFLHLGTLVDSNRFLPWLQRIIRNQAYMKLRRGGPFGKEQPFTTIGSAGASAAVDFGSDNQAIDWGDIDQILFRLSRSAAEEAKRSSDPMKGLLRRELVENLRMLMHGLGMRSGRSSKRIFLASCLPAKSLLYSA